MTKPPIDFFNKESAERYDERNSRLSSISDCMHFLIRLALTNLPTHAHVLCIGVGTGAEILSLSKEYPHWTFVGVDPSESMLEVCRNRLSAAGVLQRCELIHGYVDDVPFGENFDGALSVLVGHFVKKDQKLGFYKAIYDRLRKEGQFVNAEISFDLESKEFPSMLKHWEGVQGLMGGTPESLMNLEHQLKNMLSVNSPEDTEELLRKSGFKLATSIFQAFMIKAWHGRK